MSDSIIGFNQIHCDTDEHRPEFLAHNTYWFSCLPCSVFGVQCRWCRCGWFRERWEGDEKREEKMKSKNENWESFFERSIGVLSVPVSHSPSFLRNHMFWGFTFLLPFENTITFYKSVDLFSWQTKIASRVGAGKLGHTIDCPTNCRWLWKRKKLSAINRTNSDRRADKAEKNLEARKVHLR